MSVNNLALLVQHVIVFEQVFTDIKVVGLHLDLRLLDGARHPTMLNGNILDPDAIHQPLAAHPAHNLVFQRNVKARRAGIALATGTTAQLVVNPARLVPFGADNAQPTEFPHPRAVVHVF